MIRIYKDGIEDLLKVAAEITRRATGSLKTSCANAEKLLKESKLREAAKIYKGLDGSTPDKVKEIGLLSKGLIQRLSAQKQKSEQVSTVEEGFDASAFEALANFNKWYSDSFDKEFKDLKDQVKQKDKLSSHEKALLRLRIMTLYNESTTQSNDVNVYINKFKGCENRKMNEVARKAFLVWKEIGTARTNLKKLYKKAQ